MAYLSGRKHFLHQFKNKEIRPIYWHDRPKNTIENSIKMTIEKEIYPGAKIWRYKDLRKTKTDNVKKTAFKKNISLKRYGYWEVVARPKIIRGDQADFFKKMKKNFFSWKLLIIIQHDEKWPKNQKKNFKNDF